MVSSNQRVVSCYFIVDAAWTIVVPQLTWLIFVLFFIVPVYWRFPIFVLYTFIIIGATHGGTDIGRAILKNVARVRGLKTWRETIVQPKKSNAAIYAIHPHGRYPLDIYPLMASDIDLEHVKIASASQGKYFPTLGLVMALYGNTLGVSRTELGNALSRKDHIAIFPGGAKEMHECSDPNKIRLVQHHGFLHLAYELDAIVVPCFVFGFNESYMSILHTCQKILYRFTKLNFPIWFPRLQTINGCRNRVLMVVGTPINPKQFKTNQALIDYYWKEVGNLFERHKHRYPDYTDKELIIVPDKNHVKMQIGTHRTTISGLRSYKENRYDLENEQKSLSPALLSMLRYSTFLNIVFMFGSLCHFAWKGTWYQSTRCIKWRDMPHDLPIHITCCLAWTIASALNFFKRQHTTEHKLTGYIGVGSLFGIFISGSNIQLESYNKAQPKLERFNIFSGDNYNGMMLNDIIQTLSILQVACMSFYLVASSIRAAKLKRIRRHKETISQIHLLMTDMFTPRLTALLIRFIFPQFGRNFVVTIASIFQWGKHIQFIRLNAKHLIPHNIVSFLLSILILCFSRSQTILWSAFTLLVVIAFIETPPLRQREAIHIREVAGVPRPSLVRKDTYHLS